MMQVVALASLAGIEIDIVAGDVVGCTADEANRLVARHLARPFDETLDSNRRVKSLHPETKWPNPETKRPKRETNAANSETNSDEIVVDLSQFPTATLVDADTGVTQENVDAMVEAGLVNLEQVSEATISALKKLDTIGAATVKRITRTIAAIGLAAIDAANNPQGVVDPDDANTNTDEDDGEADESTADQASGAEGQEA